ncbi:MAG TPA: S41 family peptidase, partial [Gemmataceae bacterium]|nr:S41 family peptidase [Gemmataceae bacterium]
VLALDRNHPGIRERHRNALRRLFQVRRHQDRAYRDEVLTLKYTQALRLYEIVLHNLLEGSLERHKVDPARLFRKGLEEFRLALADPVFCQTHLRDMRPEETRTFRNYLQRIWGSGAGILSREQAVEQLRAVVSRSINALGLNPTTIVMEFTCGACYALDDYTAYLTPNQFRELAELLKGEVAGVGLYLKVTDGKLVIDEITPHSPAAKMPENAPPLMVGDLILSIDKQPTTGLDAAAAMKLLEGEVGTMVELVVASPGMAARIQPPLVRQLSSAVVSQMLSGSIGYIKIACFQETTLQDLDLALLSLTKEGMKALIIDLRDNPGGLVEVAVDVARRFLKTGVIGSVQHQDPKLNTVYHSRNPAALTFPLVLLVDGDTASAAEILAGALKENNRARLVGQTTYGKGCSQGLLRLPPVGLLKLPPEEGGSQTGGIRITVAEFFSPNRHPYTGRGVVPHLLVERHLVPEPSMADDDQQLVAARAEALRLLETR